MPIAPQPIVGLQQSVEDPNTGATLAFHAVAAYMVDLRGQSTQATFGCYISAAAHAAGRNPVGHITTTHPGTPPVGQDPAQWIYGQFAAGGTPDANNVLAGAVPVRGEG